MYARHIFPDFLENLCELAFHVCTYVCVCLFCCQYIDTDRKVFLLLSCSVKLESLLHLVILIKAFSATIRRGLSRPRGHHIVDNCAVFGVSSSGLRPGTGVWSGDWDQA